MADFSSVDKAGKVQSETNRLAASPELPFRDLLPAELVSEVLEQFGVEYRDRIYCPMVTLWMFLSQVIGTGKTSCMDAVSRLQADRAARGLEPCSPETTSYCKARQRIPECVFRELTRQIGQRLHQQADSSWLDKGHRVVMVDGSTSTMADTPENQQQYPQSSTQKEGLGFPIMRFVVLFSLTVGTVLDCMTGPCKGKKTGEQSLFRQILHTLMAGDILVGDCLFDSFRDIAALLQNGVDCIFGKNQSRHFDFRRGRKLGPDDHVVTWTKPAYASSRFESREQWEALPDELEMREIRTTIRRRGFRNRTIMIVTTLTDAERYSKADILELFRARWNCEVDLRHIKCCLKMDHLECKSPSMVRKELWTYLLGYNLVRHRMAQAAALAEVKPRQLSFSTAQKLIHTFAPLLNVSTGERHARLEQELLQAIARNLLKKRKPDRKEPRKLKKRKQRFPHLKKSRTIERKTLKA